MRQAPWRRAAVAVWVAGVPCYPMASSLPAPDRVRYGPSAVRYRVHRDLRVEQSVAGQREAQRFGASIFVTAAITGPADSLGYRASFMVDSMIPDAGTPPLIADGCARVRARVWVGRLGPHGEFEGASGDTLPPAVAELLGSLGDFLPRLPRGGAAAGAQWTDTVSLTRRGSGATVTRAGQFASTATAWEEHAGVRSLRIETSGTYRVAGAGDNGGQPLALSGTGAADGEAFVAEDGRFMGGAVRDSTTITVTLPLQGLTIPMTQVLHSTIAVLP